MIQKTIKKVTTQEFIIEADNEDAFKYANRLITSGDYLYVGFLGNSRIIKTDDFSIKIKDTIEKYESL
jgi:hypothetical protein